MKAINANLNFKIVAALILSICLIAVLCACGDKESSSAGGSSAVPTNPSTFKPVPTNPSTFEPVPTNPSTFEPVPTNPSTFEPVPTDPSTFETVPTDPDTNEPVSTTTTESTTTKEGETTTTNKVDGMEIDDGGKGNTQGTWSDFFGI